jgi:hypothetical protein
VKFGLLGDVLLADPALAALRARYPKARLRLLTDAPRHAAWLRGDAVDAIETVFIGVHNPTYRRLYDPRLWRDVLALRTRPAAAVAVFLNDTPAATSAPYAHRPRGGATACRRHARNGLPRRRPLLDGCRRHETERGWIVAG